MKKIFITLTIGLTFSTAVFGQIKTNQLVSQSSINGFTPFLDASSSSFWNNTINIGKGLVFPRVDLHELQEIKGPTITTSSNAPTKYDGMVVYNTADNVAPGIGAAETPIVTPGFYYYKNTSGSLQGGHWVRIKDATDVSTGVATGDYWSLTGNTLTSDDRYLGTKNDKNVVMKVNVDKVNIPAGEVAGYNPTKLILGNAGDAPAFTKVVIGGTPTEQAEALAKKTKNVQPAGQTTPKDFNFVLEVFGKARFKDGLVTQASTYPDYVFDNYFTGKSEVNPNYEFKKLNEVEDFIKENNHLPGVTSIKELTKSENGYNVDNTQLSIQTLEKVEELYLHVIEQQKEIQALKAELAELKK